MRETGNEVVTVLVCSELSIKGLFFIELLHHHILLIYLIFDFSTVIWFHINVLMYLLGVRRSSRLRGINAHAG